MGDRDDTPPNTLALKVGVVGVGAWLGMGGGVGVGEVEGCFPMYRHPFPFPVQVLYQMYANWGIPPLGMFQNGGGGLGLCPLHPIFSSGPPDGVWRVGAAAQIFTGFPPLGWVECRWGCVLVKYLRRGVRLGGL